MLESYVLRGYPVIGPVAKPGTARPSNATACNSPQKR
jgi:hypothetical protein